MKNKAYFIKNLARLSGKSEDDPWIQSFKEKQIVDILLEIKRVRETQSNSNDSDQDPSLWSRIFGS